MRDFTQINVLNLIGVIIVSPSFNVDSFPDITAMIEGVQSNHFGTFTKGKESFDKLKAYYLYHA